MSKVSEKEPVHRKAHADSQRAVRLTVVRNAVTCRSDIDTEISAFRREFDGSVRVPPEIHEGVSEARMNRTTTMIPVRPLDIAFSRVKAVDGFRSLAGVLFGLTAGGFLATHISTTPNLHLQVTFVSLVCLLLGLSLIPLTLGYLFGRIQINSRGIRVTPRLVGFDLAWPDLESWSIEGLQLHAHSARSRKEHTLFLNVLTQEQRLAVLDILRNCAPEKERKARR
ncbi:MAG: hypothetical protein WCK86_05765 [Planctomycetia bacterium]